MNHLVLSSPAKVNFGLDVVARRPDGYHDLRMIMQTIDLADRVKLQKTADAQIHLSCSVPGLPLDEKNLAWRAADLLYKTYDIPGGVDISLEKRIPVAAGLAGGSTNAAAVLAGMNELFDLGLSLAELQELGVRLGADVPYCLLGGTALAEGIGEVLTPLPPMPACTLVLAKPDLEVSTKYVYTHLALSDKTVHPDIEGMRRAIVEGSLAGVLSRMGNVLEDVAIPAWPQIAEIKQAMIEAGADGALMSGSGPTVFGVFADKERAHFAARKMRRRYPEAFVKVVNPAHRYEG